MCICQFINSILMNFVEKAKYCMTPKLFSKKPRNPSAAALFYSQAVDQFVKEGQYEKALDACKAG